MNTQEKRQILENYYRENHKKLVNIVARRSGSRHNGEDVVQEAFTRALTYLNTFDPENSPFENWFNKILSRGLSDFNKDKRLQGMVGEQDLDVPAQTSPYLRMFLKEIQEDVEKLPEDKRRIISLAFFEGYQPADISKIVNVNVGAIRTMLSRYREDVKHKYGESVYG